jgi:hypothetical protein
VSLPSSVMSTYPSLPKSLLASTGWNTQERAAHHVEKKLTAYLPVTHEFDTVTWPVKHLQGEATAHAGNLTMTAPAVHRAGQTRRPTSAPGSTSGRQGRAQRAARGGTGLVRHASLGAGLITGSILQ